MGAAVEVRDVAKRFRIFHEKQSTLKATILSGRRARYEEFWALNGVSFDVPQGSTFGLIGENGSGKSTLLKCMARILRPDRGAIAVNGKLSALLELGAGFHPELSGRENVYLNGSILGLTKRQIDHRFDDIIDFAGGELGRFIDTPVKNYSSGMFVRLGFAIAINVEPDVLLVDEVLAVGDEAFQHKCTEKFASLRAAGVTVVVVSHGLDAVRNLCDQAVWLEHGTLREIGPAGHVVEVYLDHVRDARREQDAELDEQASSLVRSVDLLDADHRATRLIRTGEAAVFRLALDRPDGDRLEQLVRLEIYRDDGLLVSATTTRRSALSLGSTDELTLEYAVDQMLLGTGTYDLSVVIQGDGDVELARADRVLRFDVGNGRLLHEGGFALLGGLWSMPSSADSGAAGSDAGTADPGTADPDTAGAEAGSS